MSEQPIGSRSAATIAEQLPAIRSLAALAGMLGSLPSAYLVVSQVYANRFDVQVETPADFELWREALQVPAAAVELHAYSASSWLAARTVFHGTELDLTGHGLLIDFDLAKRLPAEDAERRAAAAQGPSPLERGRAEAEAWNALHPVGTAVAAYPQTREDEPLITKTRSEAWPLGHGDVVVLVEGQSGGVCLSHVDVLPTATPPAPVVRTLADTQGGAV